MDGLPRLVIELNALADHHIYREARPRAGASIHAVEWFSVPTAVAVAASISSRSRSHALRTTLSSARLETSQPFKYPLWLVRLGAGPLGHTPQSIGAEPRPSAAAMVLWQDVVSGAGSFLRNDWV
jgi:hypothetical protein